MCRLLALQVLERCPILRHSCRCRQGLAMGRCETWAALPVAEAAESTGYRRAAHKTDLLRVTSHVQSYLHWCAGPPERQKLRPSVIPYRPSYRQYLAIRVRLVRIPCPLCRPCNSLRHLVPDGTRPLYMPQSGPWAYFAPYWQILRRTLDHTHYPVWLDLVPFQIWECTDDLTLARFSVL